jgi:hypothetical protein
MSMVAAGTASAAPHWLVCLNFGGTETKYTTNQCIAASGSGTFEWGELKGTEKTSTQGSLVLVTNGVPIVSTVEVKCSGTDEGSVGPGNQSRTTAIPVIKCEAGKNCEKLDSGAKPVGLPWNSELKETEGVIRGTIRKGAGSTSEPGWEAECTVLGIAKNNTCTTEEGLVTLTNNNTPGTVGPLLVLADFLHPNKPEAKCTTSGTTGDVLGGISILLANGDGLRVSK